MGTGFSRRDLLAIGGGVAAGVMAPATAQVATRPQAADSPLVRDQNLEADVVVVGGGMAGVCAALAAAREGASVILVQDRPVLGGNASSEVRMHCVGADWSGGRKTTDARESGIIEEIRLEDSVWNPQRSASMWDVALYDAVRNEPNLMLLLNTHCCGVLMKSTGRRAGPRSTGSSPARVFSGGQAASGTNQIAAVIASRYSTEHTFTIRGKTFVDATGDGRVGAEAGAAFRMGRESRDEYGESIAPEKPDNLVLGSTLLFITRPYDKPMPFTPPSWIHKFPTCEDLPHRSHGSWEYGYWWVEWGGELDTIADNERIRDELLAASLGVWDHIKNSGRHPQSENWALEWLGFVPGKRESRRFIGDHVLTQQEVQRGEIFEDGVSFGGWPIDLHPPTGIYSKEKPATAIGVPLYNIPLRCLYSKNVGNLMLAGRDISASHVAFGSTRVMATCAAMGQAVGTAAALCARGKTLPAALAREGIRELQQLLLKNDAYIIGATNSDSTDLARTAEVRASSETPEGRAAAVINGTHRGVGSVANRWISDPAQGTPQWIELRFREPARIREVHLVFDTGLNRPLTLTHQDAFNGRMVKGPQPETVRDYELQLLDGQTHTAVADVKGNYQRKCIHRFDPATASGIRLRVKNTNGDKSAKVFEVRAYA